MADIMDKEITTTMVQILDVSKDLNTSATTTTHSPLGEVIDLFGDMNSWFNSVKQSGNGLDDEDEVVAINSSTSSKITQNDGSLSYSPELLVTLLLILASVFVACCFCCVLCWVVKRRSMRKGWMEVNIALPDDIVNVKNNDEEISADLEEKMRSVRLDLEF